MNKDKEPEKEISSSFSEEMLISLLRRTEDEVTTLKKQNEDLLKKQLKIRDLIAIQVYSNFINIHESYKEASIDSYRAADALLRERDLGNTDEFTDEFMEKTKDNI